MSEIKEPAVDPGRLQSPSSILVYKQCPRKYFYKYIARMPSPKTIHLVRGSIAHKVMEDVYDIGSRIPLDSIPDDSFLVTIRMVLQELFRKEWELKADELAELGLPASELEAYYDETRVMINNFFHYLADRMRPLLAKGVPAKDAFLQVKPQREVELHSKAHHVRGYADAIQIEDGKTVIIDYKTSKKCDISADYRLQLGIYCMIYEELERLPDEVGIFFLKHGQELRMKVTRELVEAARTECTAIHLNTRSKDLRDYPRSPGPLCNWGRGKCEYYDTCYSPTLGDYDLDKLLQIGVAVPKIENGAVPGRGV
jgi:putative RecB family exonuclease